MIGLDFLEEAFAPLEQFGKRELSFEIEGVSLTLRNLSPEEELKVGKLSAEMVGAEGEDVDITDQISEGFLNKFMTITLCQSIVEVNGKDFRGEPFFATGEMTESGVPKKIPKDVALRDYIEKKWSYKLLEVVYSKYQELKEEIDKEADKYLKSDKVDLETEIEEARKKLKELESLREEDLDKKRDETLPEGFTKTEVKLEDRKPFLPNEATPPEPEEPVVPEEVANGGVLGAGNIQQEAQREHERLLQRREVLAQQKENPNPTPKSTAPQATGKTLDGVEVYSLQGREIPPPEKPPENPVNLDPDPKKSYVNPRFVPAKK